MRTIDAFFLYSSSIKVVLVLPPAHISYWEQLCQEYAFTRPVRVVAGGESRFQSVQSGLSAIPDEGVVAVHDGVRPLVTADIISRSYEIARSTGAAVASVALKESIREVAGNTSTALERSRFRIMQTPQTFKTSLLKRAYQTAEKPEFTDDASVAEYAGHAVTLFEGSFENLKITTPVDLVVAEAILASRNAV